MAKEWLSSAQKFAVTYRTPQKPMESKILGVLLHTTNAAAGEQTIARFQRDWQAGQSQSAHFVIDRDGNVGQCRSTKEVAWHIWEPSVRYIGIEHIAKHRQALTEDQITSSIQLILELADMFSFPLERLPARASPRIGIGIHKDFQPSGCGEGVFWTSRSGQQTTLDEIIERAESDGP